VFHGLILDNKSCPVPTPRVGARGGSALVWCISLKMAGPGVAPGNPVDGPLYRHCKYVRGLAACRLPVLRVAGINSAISLGYLAFASSSRVLP